MGASLSLPLPSKYRLVQWGGLCGLVVGVLGVHVLVLQGIGRWSASSQPLNTAAMPALTQQLQPQDESFVAGAVKPQNTSDSETLPLPAQSQVMQVHFIDGSDASAHSGHAVPASVGVKRSHSIKSIESTPEPTAVQADPTTSPAKALAEEVLPPPVHSIHLDATPIQAKAEPQTTPAVVLDVPSSAVLPLPAEKTTASQPSVSDAWPVSTAISYRMMGFYRGEFSGNAKVQWRRKADQYETMIDVSLPIIGTLLRLSSQGHIDATRLVPKVFEENRRGKIKRLHMSDDWVNLEGGGGAWPRPAHLQDAASQFIELTHQFATGQVSLRTDQKIPITLARPKGPEVWTYVVVGLEPTQTPWGLVPAYHLKPQDVDLKNGMSMDIWFSPKLQFLPIRIKIQTQQDNWLDLNLDRIDQAP
jgi:hypothetical protein